LCFLAGDFQDLFDSDAGKIILKLRLPALIVLTPVYIEPEQVRKKNPLYNFFLEELRSKNQQPE
jgi:hypothetical protein